MTDTEVLAAPAAIARWAQAWLDPGVTAVREASSSHASSQVWELTMSDGLQVEVKVVETLGLFTQEILAYSRAVPAPRRQEPRLLAYTPSRNAFVTNALPGTGASALSNAFTRPYEESAVRQHAARLLGELHKGPVPTSEAEARAAAEKRLLDLLTTTDRHLEDLRDVLSDQQLALAMGRRARLLRVKTFLPVGFVHGSFRETNWVWGREAGMGLTGFEDAGYGYLVGDFARLAMGAWTLNPSLRELSLDAYGRPLTAEEDVALTAFTGLEAVAEIASAYSSSDTHDSRAAALQILDRQTGAGLW
ncbi:phosphotransferase [Streptomyces sp. NPDC102274]|uniref:phosphotransferase n=1 Tax=Streptomyces sp. NPDC102274 TaxID=3366151 RepID=UPI0037FD1C83